MLELEKHEESMIIADRALEIEPNNVNALEIKDYLKNIWINSGIFIKFRLLINIFNQILYLFKLII